MRREEVRGEERRKKGEGEKLRAHVLNLKG